MTTAEAARLLLGWDELLLLTHVRPDGDTVGSAAALCQALRDRGKTAYLLPNPELTATYAPYAAPYAAPEGFVPRHVRTASTWPSTTTPPRSSSPGRPVWRPNPPPAARSCTTSSP